jgi:hypothetical protein
MLLVLLLPPLVAPSTWCVVRCGRWHQPLLPAGGPQQWCADGRIAHHAVRRCFVWVGSGVPLLAIVLLYCS